MLILTIVSFGLWVFDFATDLNVIREIIYVYDEDRLDYDSRFIFSGLLFAFLVAPITAEVAFIYKFMIDFSDWLRS